MLLKSEGLLERPVSSANFLPTKIGTLLTWHFQQDAGIVNNKIIDKAGHEMRPVQAGRCYLFDGINDSISITNTGNKYGITLAAWIKLDSSGGANQSIINGGGAIDDMGFSNGQIKMKVDGINLLGGVDLRDDTWHHVIYRFNNVTENKEYTLFVDGIQVNQTNGTTNAFGFIDEISKSSSAIHGKMRDVILYLSANGGEIPPTDIECANMHAGNYIERGMAAWWKMDESAGDQAYDSSGNNYTGTITNATLSSFHETDSDIQKSYQNDVGYTAYTSFDGTDDFIDFGNIDALKFNANEAFSISGWIHLDTNVNTSHTILAYWLNGTSSGFRWTAGVHRTTNFWFSSGSRTSVWSTANDETDYRNMCHVVITYDPTSPDGDGRGDVKIYYNNTAITPTASGSLMTTNTLSYNDLNFRIGEPVTYSNHFIGNQSDISVWSKTLSSDDVSELYTNGQNYNLLSSSTSESLVFWAPLKDDSHIIEDISHHQNNGRLLNTDNSFWQKAPRNEADKTIDAQFNNIYYSGRVKYDLDLIKSSCASFDGINDYIEVGTLDITSWSSFYAECWFSSTSNTGGMLFSIRHTGGDDIRLTFGSGFLGYVMDDGGASVQLDSVGTNYDDGNWYRVVCQFNDGVQTMSIYDAENILIESVSRDETFDFSTADGYTRIANRASGANDLEGSIAGIKIGQTETNIEVFYPLAEGNSVTVYDASGNNNHGVVKNAILANFWGTTQDVYHYNMMQGFSACSWYEQSSTAKIDFHTSPINIGTRHTFNIWMKWDQNECTIIGSNGGYIFSIRPFGPYSFYFQTGSGGTAVLFSDTSMEDGQLHMVTMVRDNTDFHLYIDGVFSETRSEPLNDSLDTVIQHLSISSMTRAYNGLLIDASVFDTNLSSIEITELYNSGKLTNATTHSQSNHLVMQMRDGGDGTYTDLTGAYTPTYSGTLYPMKAPKGFSSLKVTSPAFHGHNNAETKVKMPEVAPAIKQADDNLTSSFWYTGSSINELTFEDLSNNPNADNLLYLEHKTNRKENLCMFEAALSSQQNTEMNEFIS